MQNVVRPLKPRAAPVEQWTREKTDIGSRLFIAMIIGQAIYKGFRSQNPWCSNSGRYSKRGNVFRAQNVLCCGKHGHLKQNCEHGISKDNGFPECKPGRRPRLPGVRRQCDKGWHWANECSSKRERSKAILHSWEMEQRCLS